MSKVLIVDTTLREGEQTPGVNFTVDEKLEIARALDSIGVHMIEAGDPNVSKDVYQAVKLIAREGLSAEILAHCRANIRDIDKAISCDVDRVAIFLGVTDTKLRSMGMTEDEAIEKVVSAVEYAKSHGVRVRFTAEDGTRARYDFLVRICKAAVEAGADRISLPDTVGVMTPWKIKELFERVTKDVVGAEFDCHCHNDLGMAVANALAALEGGATGVHVTVNGIGERAGITSLETISVALKVLYNIEVVRLDKLPWISALVERLSGVVVPPHAPIVGENAFSHKGGVHIAAVLYDPSTYEVIQPEIVGRRREIVVSKYAGKHAVKAKLEELGIQLTNEQVEKIVELIKSKSDVRTYRDVDLIELAEKVTGMKLKPEIPSMIESVILVKCEPNVYTTSIARRIASMKEVVEVYEISGDYDIQVKVLAQSISDLNECLERIRGIKGVSGTHTHLILKSLRPYKSGAANN
ncbi:MAG: homocitrate synthase [Candidatus Nezhaarchaeota archaeon]|nr:homocitrate synthase [Candidatus Nezhaarchaeota archaeon]